MTRCSLVAGAVASGEPLTDAEREHLKDCPDCTALVAMSSALARTARGVEPGVGFSARMQVGARARITSRRRRRVTLTVLGTLAAMVVLFFGGQRLQSRERADQQLAAGIQAPTQPREDSARARKNPLDLARFDRAMAPAGDWRRIEQPLRSYRAILVQRRHATGDK